jgi:hypothetical protein
MEELYLEYFGVDTAPSNFERLEYLATKEIGSIINRTPAEEEDIYEDYLKAIAEQINFFYENDDLLSTSGDGASLGKYREGSSSVKASQSTRISPMSYKILLDIGLLYSGVRVW